MVWWFLGGLAVLALALVAGWLWQVTRPDARTGQREAPGRSAGAGPSTLSRDDEALARKRARRRVVDDHGPETVLSYLHFQHSEPARSDYPSGFHSDFGPSSLPPDDPVLANQRRIDKALRDLADGPADKAWERMKGFIPEPEQLPACLDTLERIASVFERDQRFDVARDVFEHMADLDPDWRDVKLRLMRARGLAQNATVNTWGTVPAQPLPTVTQKQLGKYIVDREIGRGAMGAVYLGYDPAVNRHVALKTMSLAQEFSGNDLIDARTRFLREAEMAGRLQHPDIVCTLDAGEIEGLAFIAMELVSGTELSQYTTPDNLLPLETVLAIGARVADALAYAHSRGVTHRDIKPANIMVDLEQGAVKLMDFGVARVVDAARTRTGVVLGTPTFMSPEQLSGQTIDGRSDLYSLGVALFQLLTGQLPYRNDSMAMLMRAIAQEEPPSVCSLRPELPPALADVVALSLQKHPNTRYTDGHQMAEDLRAVLAMLSSPVDVSLG